MAYCPECGSEITSEEIFCGNCGIALTPIIPVGEDIKNTPISIDDARDTPEPTDFLGKKEGKVQRAEAAGKVPPPLENNARNQEKNFIAPVKNSQSKESDQEKSAPPDSAAAQNLPSEKTADSYKETSENWSMPTESVEIPAQTFEKGFENKTSEGFALAADEILDKASGQNADASEAEFSDENRIPPKKASSAIFSNEEDKSFENLRPKPNADDEVLDFEPVSSGVEDNVSEQNGVFSEDNPTDPAASKESPAPKENAVQNQPKNISDDVTDDDFQATLPYTPTDFAAREALASQLADGKPPEKIEPNRPLPADSEKFAVGEDAVPIKPPVDIPVGSSMHDSLEPTSISVQIFDPKENPALSKSAKQSEKPEKTEKPKEARALTTPNIGGSDTDGKNKAKLKPLDEGTILNNRYEIVRKIGGGGMGAVYLASDKNLGGISRAVKEMVQSYIEDAQQEKAVNDFRRESMLLTSLEHPSIPTIYDYFFDEKEARFYLVMKYISGGDLAARLRSAPEGRIDEASVTEWAIQLADVLDYLHNRQPPIVYRDLKPSNIMIDGNTGRVMLIDFGIARWVNKEEKGVTAVGTMGYAPPELFSGNVEPRSDIYSLGSTMFHLLTGADPQSNPLLIFDFLKNPHPRQINPQLTDQIEQILMKTVEYSASKRFASAAELRDALVLHLDNLKRGNITVGIADGAKTAAPAADQLVFCGFCGQKILAADVFCPFCGAQQTAAASSGTVGEQAAYNAPKTTARLMIIGTNELDSPVFNLEKDNNLVGRRDPMSNIFPEVDLSKFDPQTKISRRHARIWRERDSFMVEDLGSSNGTTLIAKSSESQRLAKNQPRILKNGDKIRVGDTTLYFVLE